MTETIDKVAWIRVEDGRVLSTRARGRHVYCLPSGVRAPDEEDLDTLMREVEAELSVAIVPASLAAMGTFEAHVDGYGEREGVAVRTTCYTSAFRGTLAPSHEIDELVWLSYADRHRVSPIDQVIFDHLHEEGRLA